jgi:hypothetical protein
MTNDFEPPFAALKPVTFAAMRFGIESTPSRSPRQSKTPTAVLL